MNVYDFDKTIYHYDSTAKFYLTQLRKHPTLLRFFPKQLVGWILYGLKIIDVTEMKKFFYSYLKGVKDIDKELELFWDNNIVDIHDWYYQKHKEDDVVISASPTWMVAPAAKRLGIRYLYGSEVDRYTGKVLGPNCSRQQKVVVFQEAGFDLKDIDEFYSDSDHDVYLAREAKKAYLIVNGKITDWSKF